MCILCTFYFVHIIPHSLYLSSGLWRMFLPKPAFPSVFTLLPPHVPLDFAPPPLCLHPLLFPGPPSLLSPLIPTNLFSSVLLLHLESNFCLWYFCLSFLCIHKLHLPVLFSLLILSAISPWKVLMPKTLPRPSAQLPFWAEFGNIRHPLLTGTLTSAGAHGTFHWPSCLMASFSLVSVQNPYMLLP